MDTFTYDLTADEARCLLLIESWPRTVHEVAPLLWPGSAAAPAWASAEGSVEAEVARKRFAGNTLLRLQRLGLIESGSEAWRVTGPGRALAQSIEVAPPAQAR